MRHRHLKCLVSIATAANTGKAPWPCNDSKTCPAQKASFVAGRNDRNIKPSSLDKLKKEIFKKIGQSAALSRPDDLFRSKVFEKETLAGTRQVLYNRLKRENDRFFVEEAVVNFLGQQRALPYAMLSLVDMESGRRLDLSRLLPAGCSFVPSRLLKVKVEFDHDRHRMKSEFFPVDLKTYQEADDEGDFYFNREAARVAYGNLTAEGSILDLLHEISHAWQYALQGKSAKKDFSNLFTYLSLRLHNLGVRMEAHKKGALSSERYHYFIAMAKEKLAEKNIDLDTENILNGHSSPRPGSIIFTAHSGKKFFFRSRYFVETLGEYMKTERDAWAFALLVVRILRRNGLDPEPRLWRLEKVKAHIHPYLDNYLNSISSQIEMDCETLRFASKKYGV